VLAQLGAGFDVVSLGELERVVAAGGDPSKVVFSGVGKTTVEMQRALDLKSDASISNLRQNSYP
jgi:diaminopimelate decarboxylase